MAQDTQRFGKNVINLLDWLAARPVKTKPARVYVDSRERHVTYTLNSIITAINKHREK